MILKASRRKSKVLSSDALPVPPEALRYRVIGDYDLNNFLRGGADTVGDIKAVLAGAGRDLGSLGTILDFGCGCGRTLRWLADESRSHHLHGSDFDRDAIAWDKDNLPFAEFHVNQPLPRTEFASRTFDLIYALSVFTHLNEAYQFQWLQELKRILKPSGILIASVHGQHYIDTLPPEQIAEVERTGFYFLEGEYWKGIFPDWYQNAFHTKRYVTETFARDFNLLAHVPQGLGKRQDMIVLQKPSRRFARREARRRNAAPTPAKAHATPTTPETESPYAAPRVVTDLEDCYFYHTADIPGFGHISGTWDLRGVESRYLGDVAFGGKRVLEIGAASGALTFYMESAGADVVAYDLSDEYAWDIVPFAGRDHEQAAQQRREQIRKLNNSFWLNHAARGSKARMVYGTVYAIPESIGRVDITTFSSVLLHLRDPFLALQQALRLTRETVIVTDVYPAQELANVEDLLSASPSDAEGSGILAATGNPDLIFLPQHWDGAYPGTWWHLNPAAVQRMVGVLGFEASNVTYHFAMTGGQRTLLYTVVAQRTKQM